MFTPGNVILVLKIAVALVTVIFAASLVALLVSGQLDVPFDLNVSFQLLFMLEMDWFMLEIERSHQRPTCSNMSGCCCPADGACCGGASCC